MSKDPPDKRRSISSLQSEEKLQNFTPHPYQSLNSDGEILTVNDAWLGTLGYDPSKVEGKWFGEFLTAASAQQFESRFPSFKSRGNVSSIELEMEHANGHSISILLDGRAEYDKDGNFLRTHCQFYEITDRKEREQELFELEDSIGTVLAHVPLVFFAFDENGVFTRSQGKALDKVGLEPGEAVGESVYDLYANQPEIIDHCERALAGEQVTATVEIGDAVFESWYQPRRKDGDVVGVVGHSYDITEQKERQEQIQSLQERLELAVNGANLGVWDLDMTTGEVEYNKRLANILGYSLDEIESDIEIWQERLHPEDRPDVQARIEAYFEDDRESHDAEYRVRAADGDWKWVRDLGEVVERNEDGTPERLVGITFDIDDRKRAEITLEEERDMFADGPVVVFKWKNQEGWPTEYVSENVAEVLGYPPDEFESGEVPFADIVHDEDLDRVRAEVRENSDEATDRFSHDPYRVITKDSDIRWVMDHTKNIWEGNEITHRLGYLVDITERKEHEQKLRQFQEAVEQAAFAVYITDTDGTLEYVNPAFEEITGYDVDEVLGKTPSLLQSGEYDEAFYDALWETILSGERWNNEMVDRREDGETVVFDQTISPITDDDGDIKKFVAVARDITQRKEYKNRIELQRDNLEVLNQVVRHDIRNNLQLILLYGEMLDAHVDADGEQYLENVLSSASQAVEITTTAREVAKTLLQTDVEPTSVRLKFTLIRELEEIRSSHEHATVRVDGTIPDVSVQADDMLSSVFRNVLKNAIGHNDKEIPEVTASVTMKDGTVLLRVADNGPGITDERKEEIFEKGEKGLDSEGTGLGLYLVQTLVDRYGGDVWIEDNDPEGAIFYVELPVSE